MPDQMWNYVYKLMDVVTNPRNLAVAGACVMAAYGPRLGFTDEQMKLITAGIITAVISDMARPTSRPAAWRLP